MRKPVFRLVRLSGMSTEKSTSGCFFKGVSSCKPLGDRKSERRFFVDFIPRLSPHRTFVEALNLIETRRRVSLSFVEWMAIGRERAL